MLGKRSKAERLWTMDVCATIIKPYMRRNGERFVAIVLLVWVFADLGLQGICCEGDSPFPSTTKQMSLTLEGAHGHSSDLARECAESGCFRCCTHTLPMPYFEVPPDSKLGLGANPVRFDVPREFQTAIYHPPRA